MNIDKKEIVNEINNLTHQKYQIEQKLLSLQKQYSEFLKPECKQYIGKCYKQYVEDDDYSETVYYKVLDSYDDEDDGTQFWALVVEDHMEDTINKPLSYIYKTSINLLGHKKFFLRQLTPISKEEFNKVLDDVIDTIKQISGNIKDNKEIELKCPKCNSLGPLSQGGSMTTAVYYQPRIVNGVNMNPDGNITTTEFTCEKCGCKFIAKFQYGECIDVKEN